MIKNIITISSFIVFSLMFAYADEKDDKIKVLENAKNKAIQDAKTANEKLKAESDAKNKAIQDAKNETKIPGNNDLHYEAMMDYEKKLKAVNEKLQAESDAKNKAIQDAKTANEKLQAESDANDWVVIEKVNTDNKIIYKSIIKDN